MLFSNQRLCVGRRIDMALQKQEILIVTLTKMFAGKKVVSNSIPSAFSLLCEEFAFDGVLMYELDWDHTHLHLTESYGIHAKTQIASQSILAYLQQNIAPKRVLYCNMHSQSSSEQMQLLSLFGAQSAVIVFLADESGRTYSLIALCNTVEKQALDECSCENLNAALWILSQNVIIQTYQNRIRFAQTALEGILDNTGIDIYVNDFYNHDILYVNESMAMPYGGKTQFSGRKCWQVLFPGQTGPCEFCPQNKLIDEEGNPTKVYTWDYQRAFDGSWFRVFSAAFKWADGRLAHVVSSADITDNKTNEELVRYMANYDDLTNLPNRRMLVSECERRIGQVSQKKSFLLFFDIDGFKNINDTLGHDAGDEFLIELGRFFTGIPLLKDSTYRNGGDEFVALLGEGITEDNIRDLSRFIQLRFQKPWKLKNGTVMCGISIGVAQYPDDGVTAEELLRKADQAMYHVKKNGGGGIYFANEHE